MGTDGSTGGTREEGKVGASRDLEQDLEVEEVAKESQELVGKLADGASFPDRGQDPPVRVGEEDQIVRVPDQEVGEARGPGPRTPMESPGRKRE